MSIPRRAAYLKSIERMCDFTKNEPELRAASKSELEDRIETLKSSFGQFEKQQLGIINDIDPSKTTDCDRELALFVDTQETKIKAMAVLREKVAALTPDVAQINSLKAKCAELEMKIEKMSTIHSSNIAEIDSLNKKCADSKTQIEEMTANANPSNEWELKCAELESKLNYFESQKANIDQQYDDINQNDTLIKDRIKENEREKEQLSAQKNEIEAIKKELNKKEKELNDKEEELSRRENNIQSADSSQGAEKTIQSTSTTSTNITQTTDTSPAAMKPSLPIFNGNFHEWADWKQKYEQQIHNDADLDETDKLQFLVSLQHSAALRMVNDCIDNGMSYEQSYLSLCSMFESKYIYFMKQLEELTDFKVPSPPDAENIRSFSRLVDQINKKMSCAEEDPNKIETMLVPSVISTMPKETRAEWNKTQTDDVPTLAAILEFLYNCAEKMEKRRERPSQDENTRTSESGRVRCHHCGKKHPMFLCQDFLKMSINSRRMRVSELKLCTNCLSSGHQNNSPSCRAGRCTSCPMRGRHNSVLCFH